MKTKLFKTMAIAAFAIITGFNVYQAKAEVNEASDLLLANIEALAQNGSRDAVVSCSASCRDGIGKCWTSCEDAPLYCKRTDSTQNNCSCKHLPG